MAGMNKARRNIGRIKSLAFGPLLGLRRALQRAGLDRLARRYPKLGLALRSAYRGAYGKLQAGEWVTGEIDGLRVSAPAAARDLALLLSRGTEWEAAQGRLIESLLAEGKVFVDVGAHIGLYALRAARRVGAAGRVFAFEPAPENFRALQFNVAQNGFGNVTAERFAVGRRTGRAAFTLSEEDSASHSLAGSLHAGRRIEVGLVSLDEYFESYHGPVDVVKLDAEGAESEILDGMPQTLAANPQLVLFTELYPRAMEALGGSPLDFLERLTELEFTISCFEDGRPNTPRLAPQEFHELVEKIRTRGTGTNLLCRRTKAAMAAKDRSRAGVVPITRAERPEACAPLVSIAIPTYNRGALLDRTLESILPQLTSDAEVVVFDTGSTDDTHSRMARWSNRDVKLRFFQTPERHSLDDTLLKLLGVSRGEYVWFFSSDDRMKPGTLEAVRLKILASRKRAALVYVNQEIVDEAGRTLIASQAGRASDREFGDGRRILPFLGLNLGFVSASITRRDRALAARTAREFSGTRSLNLHLYLETLRRGGPAFYLGAPWIEARRASGAPPYDYADVFVHGIFRILDDARRRGYPRWMIWLAVERIIAGTYLPLVVSWRADNPAELARAFPAMRRVCWKHPAFWLLLAPARLLPRSLVRGLRDRLLQWRETRNLKLQMHRRLEEEPRAAAEAARV